jgi:small-conductance mechanosensitive channel
VTPYLRIDYTFDTDRALHDITAASGHIAIVVLLVVVSLWFTNRLLTPLVRVAVREQMSAEPEIEVKKRIETLSHVIYRTVVLVVTVVGVVTILPEFGVNAGPLIAGLGLIGLAVGFGAQNLVKDVINGMFILVENQYGVGDVVRIGGVSGLVEDMNLRRTVLRDQDGAVHFVPHSQITTTSNLTKGFSRVNLSVHVPYDVDIDNVFEIIDKVGRELASESDFSAKIQTAPHAQRVEQTGGGIIEISVTGETEPMEQWAVAGEMRRRLKRAFDQAGIHSGTTSPAPPAPPPAVPPPASDLPIG